MFRGGRTTSPAFHRVTRLFPGKLTICEPVGTEPRQAVRKAASRDLVEFAQPVKTSGSEKILTNIVDPNREVAPNYVAYSVETTRGEAFLGIIQSETAVLRQDIGKLVGIKPMPKTPAKIIATKTCPRTYPDKTRSILENNSLA